MLACEGSLPHVVLLPPQFQYGEDGVDVMSVGYLRAFTFLARNAYRCADVAQSAYAAQALHDLRVRRFE